MWLNMCPGAHLTSPSVSSPEPSLAAEAGRGTHWGSNPQQDVPLPDTLLDAVGPLLPAYAGCEHAAVYGHDEDVDDYSDLQYCSPNFGLVLLLDEHAGPRSMLKMTPLLSIQDFGRFAGMSAFGEVVVVH